MKITFEIYYHTRWGESLFLSGDIDELGANEENRAVMMDYQGDGLWNFRPLQRSSIMNIW